MGVLQNTQKVPGAGRAIPQNSQKIQVRVRKSHGTYRSSGYGCESGTELTEVPVIVARVHGTHISSGWVCKWCTRTPGIVERAHRTYTSYLQVNTWVNTPGMILYVPYRTQDCKEVPGRYASTKPVPREWWSGRTERTKVICRSIPG